MQDLNIVCSPPPSPRPSPPPVSPIPSPPPPCPPPPPPPTPHPPPAPIQPGEKWGAYLIELNFTYPGTKNRLEENPKTLVGIKTDTKMPTAFEDLNGDGINDLIVNTQVYLGSATESGVFTNVRSAGRRFFISLPASIHSALNPAQSAVRTTISSHGMLYSYIGIDRRAYVRRAYA